MTWLRRESIPHLVTASRLLVVAATYPLVLLRVDAWWIVAFVLLAVATDVVDGILARRWNVTSALGANLDSAADFVFYISLVAWVWFWDASVILGILPWVVVFFGLYVGALALAKLRRGTMGFHNGWTRAAATTAVVVSLWTILWGWHDAFLWILLVILSADIGQRLARTLRTPPAAPAVAEPVER